MMKVDTVVAVSFDDGSVGRMQLFERDDIASLTDGHIQAEIGKTGQTWAALGLTAVSWRRCKLEDFPADLHEFRAAWVDRKGKITVDMNKAKDCTRDRLRAERAPLLEAKDVDALRALEADDKAALADVAAEKQRLRDITELPAIDAAKTPDDLKALSCESVLP
ncbi:hypothetical protein [Mesorhizobium sp. C264A]